MNDKIYYIGLHIACSLISIAVNYRMTRKTDATCSRQSIKCVSNIYTSDDTKIFIIYTNLMDRQKKTIQTISIYQL